MSISKYCENCGNLISAESKFCRNCGVKINYPLDIGNIQNYENNSSIIKKELLDDKSDLKKEGDFIIVPLECKNDKFTVSDWITFIAVIIFLSIIFDFLVSIYSNSLKTIFDLLLLITFGSFIKSRVVEYKKLNTERKYKRFKKVIIFIFIVMALMIVGIMASIILNGKNSIGRWSCGDIITYSGQNYNTVQIGNQCWFKENLNVGVRIAGLSNASDNGIIEKYCYDNNDANCALFGGGLYQWNEAMAYSNIDGAQGICPSGWHIPKDSEWYILESGFAIGNCSSTRIVTNATVTNINNNDNCDPSGTELKTGGFSGFNGMLAGGRSTDGSFYNKDIGAFFWSSSAGDANVWFRYLVSDWPSVFRYSGGTTTSFSVRCLKD